MSDEALRELERRFAESGKLDDEVALLKARQRAGLVSKDRIRLAAALGYAAAERQLWRVDKTLSKDPAKLAFAIADLGPDAVRRAACAAFAGLVGSGAGDVVRDEALALLAAGEAWINGADEPAGFHEEAIQHALNAKASERLAAGGNPTGTQDEADMFDGYTWSFASRGREFVRLVSDPLHTRAVADLKSLCAAKNLYGDIHGTSRPALGALRSVFAAWLVGGEG